MPKELRISATVEVPDDIWQQTDRLADAKPVVGAFREAVEKMGGEVRVELVTPRAKAAGEPDGQ